MSSLPTATDLPDVDPSRPIPHDPVLPGLAFALDPSAMLGLFNQELVPPGGSGIDRCMVDRIRFRRGARAVVQYAVRVAGRGVGDAQHRWITALVYPRERVRHVWGKVWANAIKTSRPDAALRPAGFAQTQNLILQVFPVDRRLPALPELSSPQRFATLLPSLSRASAWTVTPVRYRAGLACTLRWQTEAEPDGADAVFVKAYRDDHGAGTNAALLALRSVGSRIGFAVPEPLAYLNGQRALVQQAVTGRSLADILLTDTDADPVLERAADALAVFQREAPAPERRRSRVDLLDDVARAAALVSWVRPSLTGAVNHLMTAIAGGLEDAKPTTTHGDLKPDHIVLSGDGLALLDLDSLSSGDPVADVASMVARLTGMAFRHPTHRGRLESAGRTFADAYLDRVSMTWRTRFPSHHAAALLMEATGCFRHQLPDWPEVMDVLTARAAAALAG